MLTPVRTATATGICPDCADHETQLCPDCRCPIGSAVLLHGIQDELTEALATGATGRTLGLLAVVILVAQCAISIRAGLLALRGDSRGTDLSALAMVTALTACVVLFLAGARLDYLGWALALITTQAAGMFHLDTDDANAWYATRQQTVVAG